MAGDDEKPATVTPDMLRDVLTTSTAASNRAADAIADAIASIPAMLAQALAQQQPQAPQGAAATAAVAQQPLAVTITARDLRDRRVPDFWVKAPSAWLKILDEHLDTAAPPLAEKAKFALLLPLLNSSAVDHIMRLVKDPPAAVYTAAKESLIRHFERSEEEMIVELLGLTSLGDRSAVDFLEYMRTLQAPDPETKMFRCIFLRSLPSRVAAIVSNLPDLDAMAAAADVILRSVPEQTSAADLVTSASDDSVAALAHPRDAIVDGLCTIHQRYGREAFKCAAPNTCKMRKILKKRPFRSGGSSQSTPRSGDSGNAPAGRS